MTQQTGYKNTQICQVKVVNLIKHQIPITNLQGNVQQLEGRIKILRVDMLKILYHLLNQSDAEPKQIQTHSV